MKVLRLTLTALILAFTATGVLAQTKADAIKAYNKALEEAKANDFDAAISSFTQAITIAEQIGAEGTDIRQRSEKQIPTMYYKKAVDIYREFQSSPDLNTLENAVLAFQEASDVADEYSDDRIGPRAKSIITQLYYQKSTLLYNQGDLAAAMNAVDKAINSNSNYAVAYYHKAKVFKKQNDTNDDGIIDSEVLELMTWYDRAITTAKATNNSEIRQKASEAAHDELLAVGTKAIESKEMDRAVELLTKALNYDPESADVHYRLAEAYNKQGKAQEAINHSTSSLQFENGGKTDKAKIYFELGFAHQQLGNKAQACNAFSNAVYGSFKAPAEHKMEFELKCETTAPGR